MKQAALPRWQLWLVSIGLFVLNAYICRELFYSDWLNDLNSNAGAFVSLARFYRDHPGEQWFPWFNAGSPIENAYQPLLPAMGALISWLGGLSPVRAMHLLLALLYCFGPVTLFWFAWDWSRSMPMSAASAVAYSLLSPAEWLIPILRIRMENFWGPLRLYNIVHYAENPHNLALTLLPLALLFLRRALLTRTPASVIGAVTTSAAVVLANAFGAVDLAVGGLAIAIALRGGTGMLAVTGLVSWLWISPWLPPSLIALIGHVQWGAAGQMKESNAVLAVSLTGFLVLVWASQRLQEPLERFAILFAYWLCLIPLGFFHGQMTLVPQGGRYQLELEVALCLLAGVLFARAVRHAPRSVVFVLLAAITIAGVRQTKHFRRFARSLIQPIDITQSIEYKTCRWLEKNLPAQRVMVSGDTSFVCNEFSDSPQLGAGHEPSAPNWMQLVSIYVVYTGTPENDPRGEISSLWMKAFATGAITVPGPRSREFYHPIAFPQRFDGALQVLWHEEDDTIFRVPQRSPSLARIVPRGSLVTRAPIHGLDVGPLRSFVAALDDPALPIGNLDWDDPSHAMFSGNMTPDQVVSLAVNYAPGWRASVDGRDVPVSRDAIGLMVISPGCDGPCRVHLTYGLSREALICRILSGLITVGLLLLAARGIFAAVRRAPRLRPSLH